MIVLYLLNLMWFPLTLIAGAIYFTRYFRLGWLNPLSAVAGAYLPALLLTGFTGPAVMLKDGLFDPYFQYALLVNNVHDSLGIVVLIFLVRFFHRSPMLLRLTERLARSGGLVKPDRMRRASWVFLGLYATFFVLLAQHSFSVVQWIVSPRTGYQVHREGAGQWFALAITALSVSTVLMALYQRSIRRVLLLSPLYLFLTYLLGSKGFIINFAVFLVIALALRRYRYIGLVTAVLGVAAVGLVVYSLYSALGTLDLSALAGYSDGFTNASHYYRKYLSGEIPLQNGQIFLTSFWGLIPRTVYPGKPYVYGTLLITEMFYPGQAEQTNTPAFNTVNYFGDFGWVGVLLSPALSPVIWVTAFLYALVLPRLTLMNLEKPQPHFLFLTYGLFVVAAPDFLIYFDFPNNLPLFAVIALILNLLNRLRVRSATDSASSPTLSSGA